MGIPLLHPWANRLSRRGYAAAGKEVTLPPPDGRYALDPNGLPIHGALPGAAALGGASRPERRTASAPAWTGAPRSSWSCSRSRTSCASTCIAGDAGLELVTTLRATGADAVPVSFGFHPYLRPPGDAPRAEWQVVAGSVASAWCSTTG